MRNLIIIIFVVTSSKYVMCQYDSLKIVIKNRYHNTDTFEKVLSKLRIQGIDEAINYVNYNNYGYSGVIIWKEGNRLKGKGISFRNRKLKVKKLKNRAINNESIDSLFTQKCEAIWKMDKVKRVIASEDFMIYFRRISKNKEEQIFFNYSNYLGAEDFPCFTGFRSLIIL